MRGWRGGRGRGFWIYGYVRAGVVVLGVANAKGAGTEKGFCGLGSRAGWCKAGVMVWLLRT